MMVIRRFDSKISQFWLCSSSPFKNGNNIPESHSVSKFGGLPFLSWRKDLNSIKF